MALNYIQYIKIITNWRQFKTNIPQFIGQQAVKFIKNDVFKREYLNNNEQWKQRKFADNNAKRRALLVKTGALKRSIKVIKVLGNAVVVGSTALKYNKMHNQGGEIDITAKMKRFFWAKYYSTKQQHWKAMALKQTKIKIPKRQYIGNSKELEQILKAAIEKRLIEILKK